MTGFGGIARFVFLRARAHRLLLAAALLTLASCDGKPNLDRTDGVKDAFDARPHEGIRDAGEDVGEAAEDAGRAAKDAVDGD